MMRLPKGVSPASGLPCSQPKMKLVAGEFFSTGLSSPPLSAVPVGYFSQICPNTAVVEQRVHSLYSTPHGPDQKPIRSTTGRLPVRNRTTNPVCVCLCVCANECGWKNVALVCMF